MNSRVRKKITYSLLSFLLIFISSLVLFSSMKIDVTAVLNNVIRADWPLLLLSAGCGILGNLVKAVRWRIHVGVDKKTFSVLASFFSLSSGLLADLLIPRAGEVVRVKTTSYFSGQKVHAVIGLLLYDRSIDLLMVLGMLLISLLAGVSLFEYASVDIEYVCSIVSAIIAGITMVVVLSKLKRESIAIFRKRYYFIERLMSSVTHAFKNNCSKLFLFLGAVTWGCYYMQTWLGLSAFFPHEISHPHALIVFLAGTIGMMVPVQGGIGSYHSLVVLVLSQFTTDVSLCIAFAIALHATYVMSILLSTFVSSVSIFISQRFT